VLRIDAEAPAFLVADTVITYGVFFAQAAIVYLAARLFRVRDVTFQATLVCFLYLTILSVLLGLLSMPFEVIVRREVLDSSGELYAWASGQRLATAVASSTTAQFSAAAVTLGSVFVFRAYVNAFQALYKVGRARAYGIVLTACAAYLVWSVAIEVPLLQLFWSGFRIAPK
jgi:hypothetical protein